MARIAVCFWGAILHFGGRNHAVVILDWRRSRPPAGIAKVAKLLSTQVDRIEARCGPIAVVSELVEML